MLKTLSRTYNKLIDYKKSWTPEDIKSFKSLLFMIFALPIIFLQYITVFFIIFLVVSLFTGLMPILLAFNYADANGLFGEAVLAFISLYIAACLINDLDYEDQQEININAWVQLLIILIIAWAKSKG